MSISVISLLLSTSAPAALDVPEVIDFTTFKLAYNRSYAGDEEVRIPLHDVFIFGIPIVVFFLFLRVMIGARF